MNTLIIDSHTHRYPEFIFKNPAQWGYSKKEFKWAKLFEFCKGKRSIQGCPSEKEILWDMECAEVDKMVLLGWYWETQAICNWHNKWNIKWAKNNPAKFIPFATVQPLEGNKVLEDLKQAIGEGCKGIGEIFPEAQGFKMSHPTWIKIVEFAISYDLPITLHVTEPVGHNYLGKVKCLLEDYQWLAESYPELKLILAHWGGGLIFYELMPFLKNAFKHVYYDTAASPLLFDRKIFKLGIDLVGPEKIIFGSDYPLRSYPKKTSTPELNNIIRDIQNVVVEKNMQGLLFSQNILNLLSK